MLTWKQISDMIPHQGAMCLLDRVTAWSAIDIACGASSHLSPDNPLRRDGRLGAICGVEYGLQAAALHGALTVAATGTDKRAIGGNAASGTATTARPGYLAALRDVTLHVDRLDDPSVGIMSIIATVELQSVSGSIYRFVVARENGTPLVEGCGTIAFVGASA